MPSTRPPGSPTGRPQGSPRQCGTTRPASASPSWGRSWSISSTPGAPRRSSTAAPPGRPPTGLAPRPPQSQGGTHSTSNIPSYIRLDFAYATRTVFYVMAVIMGVAGVIALLGLQPGRQEEDTTDA